MTETAACVVFDIDDTLYLERDYVRSGLHAVDRWVRRELGVPGFFEAAWDAFDRGVRGRIFDHVLNESGLEASPEIIDNLVRIYRTHTPDIELLPDARGCLDTLRAGFALAIVTDGHGDSQRAKVKALGTDRWVAPTLLTSALGQGFGKPHPRAFRMIEAATGFNGDKCTYIADNPAKDFVGPKSLGWRTVRVRRSGALHEHSLSGADVDVEIADLSELQGVIGRKAMPQWTS